MKLVHKISWLPITGIIVALISALLGLYQQYYLMSIILFLSSWFMIYLGYEKESPSLRRIVILAVMISLTVISRIVFVLTPSFKPMSAMIIICGIIFGKRDGYICGSLAAFFSNFFFGQGPWTIFQMVAWGSIGYFAGYLKKENQISIYIYAVISGIFFSLCMDIWSVLLYDNGFQLQRYLVYVLAGLPTMITYCIANMMFIWLLKDVMITKLYRIKQKYQLGG